MASFQNPISGRAILGTTFATLLISTFPVPAQEVLEAIKKASVEGIEKAETQSLFRKVELVKKYAAALDNLEKKLAADGNLDLIVKLREEKEMVEKSGDPSAHPDKPIVELRTKYMAARSEIEKAVTVARDKAADSIKSRLREEEAALTKAGKVDEALALRQEGERLLLEMGGNATADVPYEDDPRATAAPGLQPLKPITLPEQQPPFFDKPFAIKGRWLQDMTVPVAKQRIREHIVIGDRGKKSWNTIVVPPGSVWTGADNQRIELSAGKFLATRSKFEKLRIEPDQATHFFFINCLLEDCRFSKGGVWYGGDQAAKVYLDNSVIQKQFSNGIDVVDHGFRAESCVFENIDMPKMNFRDKQPADYLNHQWLRFVNCRFVNCKIPASFLLLTRDCVFDKCTFIDSEAHLKEAEITRGIEIVLYVNDCKSRISKLPAAVTLTEKPVAELKGVTIPTSVALLSRMSD